MTRTTRRGFIRSIAGASGVLAVSSIFPAMPFATPLPTVSVVSGGPPEKLVRRAVEMLGGMSRFVSRGDIVIVKPNIAWDREPYQAANTNPWVVAAVVKMCFEAGASKVKVFDRTCNDPKRCYERSGIEKAAKEAGASVSYVVDSGFLKMNFPKGTALKSWKMYRPAIEADVFINVPIAKHHVLTRVTLGMKNLMGIMGGNRGLLHIGINRKLADVAKFVRPKLTILDAVRILIDNGPQGGDPADVRYMGTVIAGTDIAAVDAYGCRLFGLDPLEQKFLQRARELGLGEIDPTKIDVRKTQLGR